jgi:hypothetical protein
MMGELDKLKATNWFNFGKRPLPYVGDLSKDFFVAVGCSFTAGTPWLKEYEMSWPAKLGKKLGLDHINIAFPGSSLEYQWNKIEESFKILPDARFIVWLGTLPERTHSKYNKILGDRFSRIMQDPKMLYHPKFSIPFKKQFEKVKNFHDRCVDKNILMVNCWGYNGDVAKFLEKVLAKKSKHYLYNDRNSNPEDYADDKIHPGSKSHETLANLMFGHITKNFPNWLNEKG